MSSLDRNTQGGLVALATALVVFILLLAISSGNGAVWVFIGAIIIAGAVIIWVMNLKTKSANSFSEDIATENDTSVLSQIETSAPELIPMITGKIKALFGTTDMDQITGFVKAMYTELEELRNRNNQDGPDLSAKVTELTSLIAELTSERDQAQAVSQKWQNKAISSTQEAELLRQEIKEHGKWQIVPEEELTDFFPTISLGDGEEPFLSSNRRQRRLMQRLSAEGYSIVKKQDTDS